MGSERMVELNGVSHFLKKHIVIDQVFSKTYFEVNIFKDTLRYLCYGL